MRAQLERILESPHFAAADRARKFLRYLVEQTLDGKAQHLKEYTIAIEVFDRDASFDPGTNPSVRVEASRLRRRLELYYLTLGREDPVLIEVPRGAYVPVFRPQADVLHLREEVSALPSALPLDDLPAFAVGLSGAPTIAILPFASLDGGERDFAEGISIEISTALARFREFHIIGRSTASHRDASEDPVQIGRLLGVRYVLRGDVRRAENHIRIHAELSNGRDGRVLWAEIYERDLTVEGVFDIQDDIANHVVATIAPAHGVITRPELAAVKRKPLEHMDAYDAVLLFYAYTGRQSPEGHARALEAVEKALLEEPDSAMLCAVRAQLYLDMYRFGFSLQGDRQEALERATQDAQVAVRLDPLSPRAYHALFLAHFAHGDLRAFREAGMRAARLNPNDTDTFAAFGLHLILIGDSALGRIFMKVALTLNPEPPDWYWFALYFMHFSAGEYEDALEMALRAQNESFYWTHCMQATAYAKLGLQTESRRAIDRLLALFPRFPAQARTELERWVSPEQTTFLLASLEEAGLQLE